MDNVLNDLLKNYSMEEILEIFELTPEGALSILYEVGAIDLERYSLSQENCNGSADA